MSVIALSHVRKSFGNKTALHDVDLEVREGEMVGLIGAPGSGKSTLLRLICGLERMDRAAAVIIVVVVVVLVIDMISSQLRRRLI